MKKIVRSFAAILPAQYNVALLIVFFGAISLASSFGQCPVPYTLSANTPSVNATPGTWTAPATGGPYLVQITAAGAKGGDGGVGTGGSGALITGSFIINAGQKLDVTAGAPGGSASGVGGGGGGSGVYVDGTQTILIIAGAGGGGGNAPGGGGQTTTSGQSVALNAAITGGNGGQNGNGGTGGYAGCGGGYLSAGTSFTFQGMTSTGGGAGFNGTGGSGSGSGGGGIGGGGAGLYRIPTDGPQAGGGGGGYSGGGSSNPYTGGGGGGSINNGTNQTNTAGANAGGGYVTITCLGPVCPSGNILYVNAGATGANTGTSWNDAFNKLQDALALTNTCSGINQVWVAKGTYYPDEGVGQTDNNINSTFALKNGVAIYGGLRQQKPYFPIVTLKQI